MDYFLYRLIPPRPGFLLDMTPAERALMQEHSGYWRGLMDRGSVLAFGPVADPSGPYGIALIQLEPGADISGLGAHDPAIKANVGFGFELHPMPSLVLPERRA